MSGLNPGLNTSLVIGKTQITDANGVVINPATGFDIPPYDYISLAYTGANLTTVVYKFGGSGGTTVATLTLAYSGSDLTSVTRT